MLLDVMEGSSSVVFCSLCGGVVMAVNKRKFAKLSLRMSQQDTCKLCTCPQPGVSSPSASKVCKVPLKASAKANILENRLLKPAVQTISDEEVNSVQVKSKIRKLNSKAPAKIPTKKLAVKRTADFQSFCAELVANNCGKQAKQAGEVRNDFGNFTSQKITDLTTPEFQKLIQDNSKFKTGTLMSQSNSCSQAGQNLFDDDEFFEYVPSGKVASGKPASSGIGREVDKLIQEIVEEQGIQVVSGSGRPTSRGSEHNTPPPATPPTTGSPGAMLPPEGYRSTNVLQTLLERDLSVAPKIVEAAAAEVVVDTLKPPISAVQTNAEHATVVDGVVDTAVSTISSASVTSDDDDDDDAEFGTSLTQDRVNGVRETVKKLKEAQARLVAIRSAKHLAASLKVQLDAVEAEIVTMHDTMRDTISSRSTHIAGGHSSRVVEELCQLEQTRIERTHELGQRKIMVLREMDKQAKLIWQLVNK